MTEMEIAVDQRDGAGGRQHECRVQQALDRDRNMPQPQPLDLGQFLACTRNSYLHVRAPQRIHRERVRASDGFGHGRGVEDA
jgi:hypothetical protein